MCAGGNRSLWFWIENCKHREGEHQEIAIEGVLRSYNYLQYFCSTHCYENGLAPNSGAQLWRKVPLWRANRDYCLWRVDLPNMRHTIWVRSLIESIQKCGRSGHGGRPSHAILIQSEALGKIIWGQRSQEKAPVISGCLLKPWKQLKIREKQNSSSSNPIEAPYSVLCGKHQQFYLDKVERKKNNLHGSAAWRYASATGITSCLFSWPWEREKPFCKFSRQRFCLGRQ